MASIDLPASTNASKSALCLAVALLHCHVHIARFGQDTIEHDVYYEVLLTEACVGPCSHRLLCGRYWELEVDNNLHRVGC